MGASGSILLPAPDDRLTKCINLLELSNTDLAAVFAMFCKYDTTQRGCLSLASMYNMLRERKSIFGDCLLDLVGKYIFPRRMNDRAVPLSPPQHRYP